MQLQEGNQDMSNKPTYEQLHNFAIYALDYIEGLKGFGTKSAKNAVDEMLETHDLLDYFGSMRDKQLTSERLKD